MYQWFVWKGACTLADNLVIVESPAKAKTIEKYLGKRYKVVASMGHVRDLPRSQMGVDFENDFEPKYITIRGKGPLIQDLKKEAKKSKKIFLASDPDREGEAIAWHLAYVFKDMDKPLKRVVFNEITKDKVKESFKESREINQDLVDAQQARRILDRVVGYNISPVLWKKVKKGLSAGRVQSVALRLIIDRENEIRNFTPEEYWTLDGTFRYKKSTFKAKFLHYKGKPYKLKTKDDVDFIRQALSKDDYVVQDIVKKEKQRKPALPFTTSSLQQDAARSLNYKARKTMMVAQQLYEGIDLKKHGGVVGLISYMRTDSTRLSDVAVNEARNYINDEYGKQYVGNVRNSKSSNAQDAHEAIRPTSILRTPEQVKPYLSKDQYKLYRLIWLRTVASLMSNAIFDTVRMDVVQGDVKFRANGQTLKFDGFLKIYEESTDDKEEEHRKLPVIEEGEMVKKQSLEEAQHFTQPPPRYTEARLVKEMEEQGIGRPSTYAPTLDTIQKRYYTKLDQKKFHPTELGEIVHESVAQYFPEIIDVGFTAEMEKQLDQIAEGNVKWQVVLKDFYEEFKQHVDKAELEMEKIEIKDEPAGEDCEKCGSEMVIKMGRYGKFMACSNFPDCRNTKPIVKTIGVKCPKCQKGEVVERKSKKNRLFYGCDQYPDCDFITWDKPIGRDCPKCSEYLVLKKKGKKSQVQCVNCDYKEEQD